MGKGELISVVGQKSTLFIKDPVMLEWLLLAGLTNFSGPQVSVAEIDATTLGDAAKKFVPGLPDYGSLSGTAHTLFGNPAQWLLSQSLQNTPPDTFALKLRIPDDGYGNGEVWGYGRGFCNGFPVEGSVGSIITSNISLRLTGPWTWERPTEAGVKLKYSSTDLIESGLNDGTVKKTVRVDLIGDVFKGTKGQPLAGVTFIGAPDDLKPAITKISDQAAVISFSGAAKTHDEGFSDTIQVVFKDAAFTNTLAAEVLGHDRLITINWS